MSFIALRRMGRENGVAVNSRVNNRRGKLNASSPNPTKVTGNKKEKIGLNPKSSQKELSSASGKEDSRSVVKTYQCEPTKVSHSKRRFRWVLAWRFEDPGSVWCHINFPSLWGPLECDWWMRPSSWGPLWVRRSSIEVVNPMVIDVITNQPELIFA